MIVRRGITRTVVLTRRYAIKLPSLRSYGQGLEGRLWSIARGLLANQSEKEWAGYEANRGLVCPVLRSWLGGLTQVYPRCAPLRGDEAEADLPRLDPNPGDDKPTNFGWLNGRIVRIDYDMSFNGCPHDRSGFVNRMNRMNE